MKPLSLRIPAAIFLIACAGVAGGCAGARPGVEPWERDLLASDAMQLDANAAKSGNDEHIYFSKEGASGGSGFGGGGCGCN